MISSPTVVDGVAYVGSEDQKVYAFSTSDGTKVWEFKTGGPVFSSCCVGDDGVLYVGSEDKKVYALSAADGTKLWDFSAMGPVCARPAVDDGVVYFGSDDQKAYALVWSSSELGRSFCLPF